MHARAEQLEPAFAAEGIVARQNERPVGTEVMHEQAGKNLTQAVQRPSVVGEEAVEAGPVADADLAGGEDAFGDEAVAAGQRPAGEDQHEEAEGGGREDVAEVLEQDAEGGSKLHGSASLRGERFGCVIHPNYATRSRKPTFFYA
jgi:hypothetical protein